MAEENVEIVRDVYERWRAGHSVVARVCQRGVGEESGAATELRYFHVRLSDGREATALLSPLRCHPDTPVVTLSALREAFLGLALRRLDSSSLTADQMWTSVAPAGIRRFVPEKDR
jgi:hypothetical protein